MLSNPILFAILAVLASPALAGRSAWRQPCYVNGRHGILDGALCLVADATVDVEQRDLLDGGLLGIAGHHDHDHGAPGFGWFHPGAYQNGDRCWQHDREGVVANALCVIAGIHLGEGDHHEFDGRFDRPYYGYGHNFGWYHPGPYVEGDRCFQDNWNGYVRDALCVQVDATTSGHRGGLLSGLGLGKRSLLGPDFWEEPRFSPHHNFGWFHDGDFVDGDRCWAQGWYGSVKDSICVVAKLGLDLKRDGDLLGGLAEGLTGGLLNGGHSGYRNGERCFKRGGWGRWWHDDCDVVLDVDAVVNLGEQFSSGPFQEGDKCWRAGSWGYWRGSDCNILAKVDIELKRGLLTQPALLHGSPRFEDGIPCRYDGHEGVLHDTLCIVADVDIDVDHSDLLGRRAPLLGFAPGENRGHALGKTISNLLDGVKTRSLLGGFSQGGGLKQLDTLKLDQLQQLGGLGQAHGSGAKGNDLIGGLLGGGLLGKREHGLYLSELVDTLGLGKRSTDLTVARQLGSLGGLTGDSGLGKGNALGKLVGGITGGR